MPSASGWQVLLLGAALIGGGTFAGLSLMRDLGLLLAALAAAGLLAGWTLALIARPGLQQSTSGEVRAGEQAIWRLALTTHLPRWMPLWVTWRVNNDRFTIPVNGGRLRDLLPLAPARANRGRPRDADLLRPARAGARPHPAARR
ncbi:hypothetical protein [Actinomyces ruminis]|uniref:hypothetical protein n=1 Tax=Actinomyces ruminis TaxID=1937003 RepID=UPI001C557246|nr:hypothetical protein [Actinomyces ruminis]